MGRGGVAGSGVRSYYRVMLRKRSENSLQGVEKDLRTLKDAVRDLQTDQRLLQVEWEETHRKITNTLRSIARSGGKKLPADDEILQPAGVPSGVDQISAAIHARRNRAVSNAVPEAGG